MVMRVRSGGLRDETADTSERPTSHESVALRVIQLRMRVGISQEELARRVGTTKSAISRLESGRHRPNVETLQRIAEAVGARLVITFE
jgi:transcriptional regulator with XRE-family HTH domain